MEKDTLLAAISRACVSTKLFAEKTKTKTNGANASEGRERGAWWMTPVEKISGSTSSIKYRFDAAIMPDPQGHTRGFISSICNQHKIGRNELSSSILRILSRYDEIHDQTSRHRTYLCQVWAQQLSFLTMGKTSSLSPRKTRAICPNMQNYVFF
jgi:hypothetical protein